MGLFDKIFGRRKKTEQETEKVVTMNPNDIWFTTPTISNEYPQTIPKSTETEFDIFIQINGKMVRYISGGDSFEGVRLARLKSKKLKRMYIRPEDEPAYLQYVERNIEMAYDAKSGKSLESCRTGPKGFCKPLCGGSETA